MEFMYYICYLKNQKNQKTFTNKFTGSLNEFKNKKEVTRINVDNEKLAKKLINWFQI